MLKNPLTNTFASKSTEDAALYLIHSPLNNNMKISGKSDQSDMLSEFVSEESKRAGSHLSKESLKKITLPGEPNNLTSSTT